MLFPLHLSICRAFFADLLVLPTRRSSVLPPYNPAITILRGARWVGVPSRLHRSRANSTAASSSVRLARFTSFSSDRKSTRLNSSHLVISYAVFCLKKKNIQHIIE